jgi:hypothetical protein
LTMPALSRFHAMRSKKRPAVKPDVCIKKRLQACMGMLAEDQNL